MAKKQSTPRSPSGPGKTSKPIGHTRKQFDKLFGYKISNETWKFLQQTYVSALEKYECGGKPRICLFDEQTKTEHACGSEINEGRQCCLAGETKAEQKRINCPVCKAKLAKKK